MITLMALYSTTRAAKLVGIGNDTLHRWMRRPGFTRPRVRKVGGVKVRLWTEVDIARLRRYKAQHYGEGKGLTKRM